MNAFPRKIIPENSNSEVIRIPRNGIHSKDLLKEGEKGDVRKNPVKQSHRVLFNQVYLY
jgi:hypothetical protein